MDTDKLMDKWQAINVFWNGFGLAAYDESSVQTGDNAPELPYITYSAATGDYLTGPVALSASLWYRSTSWQEISKKADEISRALACGGQTLILDEGFIWLTKGSPFSQRISDEDDSIRRIYINISADFNTSE